MRAMTVCAAALAVAETLCVSGEVYLICAAVAKEIDTPSSPERKSKNQ